MKSIWFDIDNSPHVLLFAPIIKILQNEGYDIIVTARDFAQTLPLLDKYKIPYIRVDGHGGRSKMKKILATLKRAYGLYKALESFKIDLMVNHGARAGIIAAKALNVPVISAFDYEHTELFIIKHLSNWIVIPSVLRNMFPDSKFSYYDGIKEEIYLCDFIPDENFLKNLPFKNIKEKPLITIRPPARHANYHNEFSEIIYRKTLDYICNYDCYVVLIPRTKEDLDYLKVFKNKIFISDVPLDGPNLIYYSDAVISGGGTMVREASVLGTPSYSIFTGKPAAIDLELSRNGRLTFIRTLSDIKKIKIEKKINRSLKKLNCGVREQFIKIILDKLKN
jgi:uncharacterized protein